MITSFKTSRDSNKLILKGSTELEKSNNIKHYQPVVLSVKSMVELAILMRCVNVRDTSHTSFGGDK